MDRNTQNIAGGGPSGQNINHGASQQAYFGTGPQINVRYEAKHHYPSEQRHIRDEKELKEKRDEIIQGLYKTHYKTAKDRNPDRVPGTCEWFVNHDHFRQWRDSTTSCFLWVSADPGCGKSVLAKYLIDEVLPDKTSTICYFFFKGDFPQQRSATNALSCILHQLFSRRSDLLTEDIITLFKNGTGLKPGSVADLWEKLVSSLQPQDNIKDDNSWQNDETQPQDILCIIDAFDECADGMRELATQLCKFYSAVSRHDQRTSFNLKILITSRPYQQIRRQFQPILERNSAVVHLDGDGDDENAKIQDEIDIFIEYKVNQIGGLFLLSSRTKHNLLIKLREIPSRTYLWVYLTFDWVQKELENDDEKDISRITSSLPPSVDEAYEALLSRSRKPAKARNVLHIILAATIPLSLEEMYIALSIEPHHTDYDITGTAPDSADIIPFMDDARFRGHLREMCGLFVTIVDSKVYLLHQTAREFLIANKPTIPENGGRTTGNNGISVEISTAGNLSWKSTFDPRESEHILLDICINYLCLDAIHQCLVPTQRNLDVYQNFSIIRTYLESRSFLSFLTRNWSQFLRQLDYPEKKTTAMRLSQIPRGVLRRPPTWFEIMLTSNDLLFIMMENASLFEKIYIGYPQGFTSLMIASYCGWAKAVGAILQDPEIDVNTKCQVSLRSALHFAAENGSAAVVKLLLAKRTTPGPGGTEVAELSPINVNSINARGMTPSLVAMFYKRLSVVRLLLEAGADVNAADNRGYTLLSIASIKGLEEGVKVCLRFRADINAVDEHHATPLVKSIQHGYGNISEVLIRHGASVDMADDRGTTPLIAAVLRQDTATLRLLISAGAKVDKADRYKQTPLLLATEEGYTECVGILLKAGARVDVMDVRERSVLSLAIYGGYDDIESLLRDAGAVE